MSISTALSTARRGTVFLSLVCFAISYIALADLARIAGLGPQGYLWPIMVDGVVVIGSVAVLAQPDWHSWSLLIAGAAVSIAGNGVHAWATQGTWIAVAVALVPPVFLLWVTNLTTHLGQEAAPREPQLFGNSEELPDASDPRSSALELMAEHPTMAMREIARRVGTDDRNVRRWRDESRTAQCEVPSMSGG